MQTLSAITSHCCEHTRSEIASGVDCISGLHANGRTNSNDGKEENERDKTRGRRSVVIVRDGANNYEENCRAQEFVEESADVRDIFEL